MASSACQLTLGIAYLLLLGPELEKGLTLCGRPKLGWVLRT